MIAITLLSYKTQYVKATIKKGKLKITQKNDDFDPILEAFRSNNYEYMYDTLKDIVNFTKNRSEEFSFIIPDTEFYTINTEVYEYKIENDENDRDFLEQNNIDIANYYYCFPTQMKTNDKWLKTYYTINKKNIDTLLKVAKDLDIVVKNIEPLSIALFRYMNNWERETYILEINNTKSDVVFFSPIFGFYKYQLDLDLSYLNTNRALKESINEQLSYADNYFAKQLNNYLNANQDIIIITSNRIKQNLNYEAPKNKQYITNLYSNSDDLIINNDEDFNIGIGSLLQSLTEDINLNYKSFNCLLIKSANILPKNFVSESNLLKYKYSIQKKSKVLTLILAGILSLQIGAIVHFNDIVIPDTLQDNYALASKELKNLEQQEKTIKEATTTKEKPLEVLTNLIKEKPNNNNLGFTQLEIAASEGKNKTPQWIKLGLISDNSLTIKGYVTKLTENEDFGLVNVTSIDNNAKGAKIAEISILKPGQDIPNTKNKDKETKNDNK